MTTICHTVYRAARRVIRRHVRRHAFHAITVVTVVCVTVPPWLAMRSWPDPVTVGMPDPVDIPEPSAAWVPGFGLGVLAAVRRRRKP